MKNVILAAGVLPIIIIGGVLVAAIGIGVYFYYSPATTEEKTPNGNKRPPQNLAPGANPPHVRNSLNSKVVIEEFADFECPVCATVYGEMKKVENEFGDKITVIFRQMPLVTIHRNAMNASLAAEAAGKQGRFWEMHDILYEKQDEWKVYSDARDQFARYAQSLGLNVAQFQNDMVSLPLKSRVDLDIQRANSMRVTGTPTIFINGKQVPVNDMNAEGLGKHINQAMSEAAAPQ